MAIQKLESIFCPNKKPISASIPVPTPGTLPAAVLPNTPVPAPIPVTFEPIFSSDPVPNVITQLSQDSLPAISSDPYRYATRYSLSQDTFSLACGNKNCSKQKQLQSPTLPSTPVQNMFQSYTACPVIDQISGKSLEYRHLMKGTDKKTSGNSFC